MVEEQKHPVDQIEPAALSDSTLLYDIQDCKVDHYRLQLSIAISLKRIADGLEGGIDKYGDFTNRLERAIAEGMRR